MKIKQLCKKTRYYLLEIGLNSLAFSTLIISQQLIALPLIAKKSGDKFGDVLTIFAIINIISSLFGSGLGASKLIQKNKYVELKIEDDFKYILFMYILIASVMLVLIIYIFFNVSFYFLALTGLIVPFTLIRNYSEYDYRYQNKTKEIFYFNSIYAVLLSVSACIYSFSKIDFVWLLVFLVPEFFTFIYNSKRIRILKERNGRSIFFKETLKKTLLLSFNNGLSYSLNTSDRLLLNPMIGSNGVATYYSSSFVAKMGSLVLSPICSVVLRKLSNTSDDKMFKMTKMAIYSSGIVFIFYFLFLLLISPLIIWILYPQYYVNAMGIYGYTSFASACSASGMIIKQVLMRYHAMKKVSALTITYGLIYIVLAFLFTFHGGIKGFAISTMISNIILYSLMIFLLRKGV